MIAPLVMGMQNSISAQNLAQTRMMQNMDAISFCASQPLRPSFILAADTLELQNKANETRLTVAQQSAKAMEEALAKNIKRSTPKYAGLDYKA